MDSDKKQNQYTMMTTEPIEKLLVKLSIPTVLSMMITTIYNLVDTAFVGTLGTSESGATGVVFGYMTILQAFAFLCGQGAGSNVSRSLGAKNNKNANMYGSSGFFLCFSLGVIIAVFSFLFMTPLVYLLGSTTTIEPYAKKYIFWILLSAPFFMSSFSLNNILRFEGRAKLGTVGMLTGAALNILGDAIFMFGFKLGIDGAGLSTALSQLVSFTILLSMYLRGKTEVKMSLRYISRDIKTYVEIIATGFPSLLRQGLNSVATMLVNRYSGVYGDAAVAAMSIVTRISFFPMAIAIGIGQGFQPICGFNFGAGKKDRVKRGFWSALVGAEVVLFLVSVPIFIYAAPLIQSMRDDMDVVNIGVRALRLMCVGQMLVPLTMMVEMGFQSSGEKLLATFSSSMRSGLLFIPSLIVFSSVRQISGIQEAQPFSFLLSFGLSVYLCKIFMEKLRS